MVVARVLVLLLASLGVILPDPAWAATGSRIVRHAVPGIAVIPGGLMLFPHSHVHRGVSIASALAGGVRFAVAPGRMAGTR